MSTRADFEIHARPGTDIWRKPPTTNAFNAPTICLDNGALNTFQRARLSFALPKRSALHKYDQGGLLLCIKRRDEPQREAQWIKSGVEFYLDQPWVGTVCCDRWADWSITPLVGGNAEKQGDAEAGEGEGDVTATIEVERSRDEMGRSLWIYAVEGGKRVPVREVNWIFADDEGEELVWLEVRAYAARPLAKEDDGEESLVVKFLEYEVEWTKKPGSEGL
ncbi:hypothetical protein DRE_01525 [Drechslerella stenobrocha 248]|uniref:Uncharacterized protein n=1 Tax=Drechslerella stenobrocha 248 TaxID=1043628 RepID=W7HUX5_9PEZI|nr:hypothetical protein DRE_01525 [Drechslerella stenobrocha 248]